MVKKYERIHRQNFKNHIKADVIILGCSLPGIVTAHNLKKKFGDSVDIVVLDQVGALAKIGKAGVSVAFQDVPEEMDEDDKPESAVNQTLEGRPGRRKPVQDTVARYFLEKYASDFRIPLPSALQPRNIDYSLRKLFQDTNGSTVPCKQNFHEFDYLGFIERFEMLQYQNLIDRSMQNLFHMYSLPSAADRQRLLYFDETTMETHICNGLTFSTSRDIMRTIVELVCGTSADKISVLFYLHQCYRISSCSNQIDGDNVRFRGKLIGQFRRRLTIKLQQSVADTIVITKPIKEIRTSPGEQVILEPAIGETDYICDLLAMAINPDQLRDIVIETKLVDAEELSLASDMEHSIATQFIVEYETNFWQRSGYSGDILSIRGPIMWATERPLMTKTRTSDKYVALIGYLKVNEIKRTSKEEVLDQLVMLFGDEARNPVSYTEIPLKKIYVPRIGCYADFRRLATESAPKYLEWGTLDIFAEGDVTSALEAGHMAYIHLLSVLRPQAVTYEDVARGIGPTNLYNSIDVFLASFNVTKVTKYVLVSLSVIAACHIIRNALRK